MTVAELICVILVLLGVCFIAFALGIGLIAFAKRHSRMVSKREMDQILAEAARDAAETTERLLRIETQILKRGG